MDNEISIKSKERVSKFGEVFTPSHIVEDMLNMDGVKEYTYSIDKTFLEPSCGNGNFLVAILRRKLSCLDSIDKGDTDVWKMSLLQAVSTIYGIDIQLDNVEESIDRMKKIVADKYEHEWHEEIPDDIKKCLDVILKHNIVCGDFLTGKFKANVCGAATIKARGSDTLQSLGYRNDTDLTLMEWDFNKESKTVKITGYKLEEIKKQDKGTPDKWFEEIAYNKLFRAKEIGIDSMEEYII